MLHNIWSPHDLWPFIHSPRKCSYQIFNQKPLYFFLLPNLDDASRRFSRNKLIVEWPNRVYQNCWIRNSIIRPLEWLIALLNLLKWGLSPFNPLDSSSHARFWRVCSHSTLNVPNSYWLWATKWLTRTRADWLIDFSLNKSKAKNLQTQNIRFGEHTNLWNFV